MHDQAHLCGTAAGFNLLPATHTHTCDHCKAASRKWFQGYQAAVAGGYREEWVKANPPKSVTA